MPAIFQKLDKIRPVYDVVDKIVMVSCKLLLIADILITTYQVLGRYVPFIKHQLLSIALNSVSKFQVRVLPTILEYKEKYGAYPPALTFSMAALIAFYRTDNANDGEEIMKFMKAAYEQVLSEKEAY